MEEFIDAMTGGAVWGVGFAVALGAARGIGAVLRPMAKGAIRGAVAVGDWIQSTTAEGREQLQDLYAEAKAEQEAAHHPPSGAAAANAPEHEREAEAEPSRPRGRRARSAETASTPEKSAEAETGA